MSSSAPESPTQQLSSANLSSESTDAAANSSLESITESPTLTEEVEYDEYSGMVDYLTDWIASLSRDDLSSVSILLWHVLVGILGLKVTYAAETIGNLLGRSDCTVRDWRTTFNSNNGSFPDTLQGKYQRTGVVWQNEDMNKKARKYVQENAVKKGKPNLTAISFCQWVNECLLVVEPLEPGYPRRITVETARKWLLALGFSVMEHKKGAYVDGHERDNVVQNRKSSFDNCVL